MHRSEATMLWDVQHTAITRNVDYWGASTKSYLATKQVSSKICPVPPVQSWSERGKQSENSAELRVFKACHAGRSGDDKILRPNNDPIDFQQWPWPLWAPVNCDLRDCFPPHIEWSRRIPNTSRFIFLFQGKHLEGCDFIRYATLFYRIYEERLLSQFIFVTALIETWPHRYDCRSQQA